jgi:GNAT superfamily N-acetyltransferase
MDSAAVVHRASFDECLPWLAGRHSAEEDRQHFRECVYKACTVWGAFESGDLRGIIAFRKEWIDHLYVLPRAQNLGIGSGLLEIAKASYSDLSLWTFQRNERARRFYETHGFIVVRQTDGSGNEEHEPDVLYRWK